MFNLVTASCAYLVFHLHFLTIYLTYRHGAFSYVDSFLIKLAARVEGKSPTDESILQKLVEKVGGEVQMAVKREDHVPLYDHDVVAPLIMKETDIASAAARNALLEKRTTERCKRYLLQRKRLRKGENG